MKKENEIAIENFNIILLRKYPFSVVYGVMNNLTGSVTVVKISKRKMNKIRKTIFDRFAKIDTNEVTICTVKNLNLAYESYEGIKLSSRKGAISMMSYKETNTVKIVIYAGVKTCEKIEITYGG